MPGTSAQTETPRPWCLPRWRGKASGQLSADTIRDARRTISEPRWGPYSLLPTSFFHGQELIWQSILACIRAICSAKVDESESALAIHPHLPRAVPYSPVQYHCSPPHSSVFFNFDSRSWTTLAKILQDNNETAPGRLTRFWKHMRDTLDIVEAHGSYHARTVPDRKIRCRVDGMTKFVQRYQ
jgi:hypothetical protein